MTEERKIGAEIGNVVWFDQKKGFGFIKDISGSLISFCLTHLRRYVWSMCNGSSQ